MRPSQITTRALVLASCCCANLAFAQSPPTTPQKPAPQRSANPAAATKTPASPASAAAAPAKPATPVKPDRAPSPAVGTGARQKPGAVQPAVYRAPETIAPGTMNPAPGAASAPGVITTPGSDVYYDGGPSGPMIPGGIDPNCGPCQDVCFMSGKYVRLEYLAWNLRGMNVPALVTTSPQGTAQANAGVLGEEGTSILFGGDTVNSELTSGGRLVLGWWFDPCRRLGVEGDYVSLGQQTESFRRSSTGNPILARPFYDVSTGQENASLTAFPNVVSGALDAHATTVFQAAGVRAIYNLACGSGCGTSCCTNCPVSTGYRIDALLGYRFLRVDDSIGVVESSTSLETNSPGSFFIRDSFRTQNQFHGFDLGYVSSFCQGCWSVDVLSKIAVGNTNSRIAIRGSSAITDDGETETFTGGVLAQRTNIGVREFNELAVVPELGFNVGYQINPCWRATIGYSFIYWSRVARAGDQIDRQINPNLFPPEDDEVTTNLQPAFVLHYTDFWAQGMSLGLEGSW